MNLDEPTRQVRFRPAFHRCHSDPHKNYGIGGIRIVFTLSKENRGVEWELLTNMGMPLEDFKAANPDCDHPRHVGGFPSLREPTAGPVQWHSPEPIHDPEASAQDCRITGGACWSDVGFLLGDDAYRALAVEGEEALWAFLTEMLEEGPG